MAAAVRENKNIKRIQIYEKVQKPSLYADDTTLYLAAQEENLNLALNTLQQFQHISGLKINIEETNLTKIGVWWDSRSSFCKERD